MIGINKWYQSFALRNFDLEVMEFESAHSNTTAKLPILKLGKYEMWVIRIKQYFQIQDYALWEVIENVKDDDIANDAIPLATKLLVIVEYKIIKEGIIGHYQLIRADGSSKRYSSMIRMLQGIDREDLETLWKLVKTKHGDKRPEDEHERVL
ncbi:hypothetical protein Tco_0323843 [Tanacetum coccineum]